jgi:hypothetical protein
MDATSIGAFALPRNPLYFTIKHLVKEGICPIACNRAVNGCDRQYRSNRSFLKTHNKECFGKIKFSKARLEIFVAWPLSPVNGTKGTKISTSEARRWSEPNDAGKT